MVTALHRQQMLLQQLNKPAPAGGQSVAPGEAQPSLGIPSNKINRACEAGDRGLAPQMSFIEINPVRSQQHLEFFFERELSMMLLLIANVSSHMLNLRLAYRECSESSLPSESASRLAFHPT